MHAALGADGCGIACQPLATGCAKGAGPPLHIWTTLSLSHNHKQATIVAYPVLIDDRPRLAPATEGRGGARIAARRGGAAPRRQGHLGPVGQGHHGHPHHHHLHHEQAGLDSFFKLVLISLSTVTKTEPRYVKNYEIERLWSTENTLINPVLRPTLFAVWRSRSRPPGGSPIHFHHSSQNLRSVCVRMSVRELSFAVFSQSFFCSI
eukprot:COSAG02_NODE_723_length_18041_cov_7.464720_20_plen_206_part_00